MVYMKLIIDYITAPVGGSLDGQGFSQDTRQLSAD